MRRKGGPIRNMKVHKTWGDNRNASGPVCSSPETKVVGNADHNIWSLSGAFFQEASGNFREFAFTIGIIPQRDEAMRVCLKRLKQTIGNMRNWGVLHHAIPKGGGKSFIIKDEFLNHEMILGLDPSRAVEIFEEMEELI